MRPRPLTLCVFAASAILAAPRARAAEPWNPIGPWGGQINALAIDPSAPQTIYAAAYAGGVYKTTDGARSWASLSGVLREASVLSLAIAATKPQAVFAGTYGDGLYRSSSSSRSPGRSLRRR